MTLPSKSWISEGGENLIQRGTRHVTPGWTYDNGLAQVSELHFAPAESATSEQAMASPPASSDAVEDLFEMEVHLRIAAAREEALTEARLELQAELTTKMMEERRRIDRLRVEYARDRQRFFAAAESQVVHLALAIASRILARKVAAEELHLESSVRAALARVQSNTATELRVPVAEVDGWKLIFLRTSAGKVTVVGDDTLVRGDCVLETTVGRVEFGIDVQMGEIRRGFEELLQDHT